MYENVRIRKETLALTVILAIVNKLAFLVTVILVIVINPEEGDCCIKRTLETGESKSRKFYLFCLSL